MQRGLTAKFISEIDRAGRFHDARGTGLFLIVGPHGRSKSFGQRVVIHGIRRDIGLGSVRWLSLTEARAIALENWKIARRGGDPLAGDRAAPTFAEAVEAVIAAKRDGWRDDRSEQQWRASLTEYAMPRLGDKRVDQIKTADVLAVLQPHWHDKATTMQRVRQRISAIMKYAIANGYRGDDPAGPALQAALPKNGRRQTHLKALAYSEVAAAIARIRASGAWPGVALALEFAILTAARSGEVRGATWAEFDIDAATWTVPGERIKGGIEHRVPLSGRALEILAEARPLSGGVGLVFPSMRGGMVPGQSFVPLLRDVGVDATAHGFRSSFRDWAAECTNAPREVCEAALAHINSDRVEAAYRRSDLFDRRRALMLEWADYISR